MQILGLQKTTLLDYPGEVAATIFTGGCNFRCPYCHNGDLVLGAASMSPISEEEVMGHLNRRRHVLTGVCITGGEPTLQPDLEDFIRRVKGMGYLVKLDTNGSHPRLLQKLVGEHLLDYVAMDIKHCREKYGSVACSPSFSLADVEESVSFLLEGNVAYEFRTTVVRELHCAEDMERIGRWIAGADRYFLQSYRESENVISPVYTSPDKEEIEQYLARVRPYVDKAEVRGID